MGTSQKLFHCGRRRLSARVDGFTLIELLIVITIIAALIAMTIPAIGMIRDGQNRQGTEALLSTISNAMRQFGRDQIFVPNEAGDEGIMRPLWDFNADGYLDGDPQLDFSTDDAAAAERAEYRGPFVMLGLTLAPRLVDSSTGRVLDNYGNHLRVSSYPPGSGNLQVWSVGPDGEPDVDADGDDIKPWRSRRER